MSLVPVSGEATTWSLRFPSAADYLVFNHRFNQCLWEFSNKLSWAKAKVGLPTAQLQRCRELTRGVSHRPRSSATSSRRTRTPR